MDSRIATREHIQAVQGKMAEVIENLLERSKRHDDSKLISPEVEYFDKYTPLLAETTYGTDEYRELLRMIQPALDHHYAAHRHHPEHWPNGIQDMTLLDLIEMICDWIAAALRHAAGDVYRSVDINQKRFGYSDELKKIFLNTLDEIGSRTNNHTRSDDPWR
jgi:hypothetical protein